MFWISDTASVNQAEIKPLSFTNFNALPGMYYRKSADMMATGEIPARVTLYEYFYVLILILYAGFANRYVLVSTITDDPLIFFLPVLLSGILALKFNIVFNKSFHLLLFFFFVYFVAVTIKYGELFPTLIINFWFKFFLVYVTVKALKLNFFLIFEELIYYLSIIGLTLWGIQVLLGGDTLYGIISKIPGIQAFSHVTGGGLNAVIYSIQPSSFSKIFDYLPPRNCGFAWEPGGFAVYLCLALFVNLFVNNSGPKSKVRFTILLIALLSTQSTTGFVIFLVILLYYYANKNAKTVLIALPVFLVLLNAVFSLPFMSDKIVSLIQETSNIDLLLESGYGRESSITPQRFTSFLIAIKDFYANPILGTAGITGSRWIDKIGVNISTISGIGNLLAQFGIIGFLFFTISTIKTSYFFSRHFNFKGKLLLFLIILGISVSYSLIDMPLVMSFWLFDFFESPGRGENRLLTVIGSRNKKQKL